MSNEAFAARFPTLFHVTDRSALPTILRWGLLSAEHLCTALGVPEAARAPLLHDNREQWCRVIGRYGRVAWLRRQNMRDGPMATRLAPGLTPASWRRFINGMTFLFPDEAAAWGLRWARGEAVRDQVVLAFDTGQVLASGAALVFCPFNNGYLDRSAPGPGRRLRGRDGYRSAAGYQPGDRVHEIAVRGGIPPTAPFTECPSRPAQG